MKVANLKTYNSKNKSEPNFASNFRHIKINNKLYAEKYSVYTTPFRGNTNEFIEFLRRKYAETPRVSFFSHACSIGLETYSYLYLMLQNLSKEMQNKFIPLMALDFDKENIEIAKSNYLEVEEQELFDMKAYMKNHFEVVRDPYQNEDFPREAFKKGRMEESSGIFVRAKDILRDKVTFAQGNIFEDLKTMPNQNVILPCMNFWPYLTISKAKELASLMAQKFDSTSTIRIGDYDRSAGINQLLESKGFRETWANNVFVKKDKKNNYLSRIINFMA